MNEEIKELIELYNVTLAMENKPILFRFTKHGVSSGDNFDLYYLSSNLYLRYKYRLNIIELHNGWSIVYKPNDNSDLNTERRIELKKYNYEYEDDGWHSSYTVKFNDIETLKELLKFFLV